MKKCSKCKIDKPFNLFNKKLNGLQGYCRDCSRKIQREYYQNNKTVFKKKAKDRKIEIRDRIRKICEENPCTDCGLFFHFCQMDFDHLRDKEFEIGNGNWRLGKSWISIQEEMKKCELVCSNCHRLRTFNRNRAL
jgi:hypothetical protein